MKIVKFDTHARRIRTTRRARRFRLVLSALFGAAAIATMSAAVVPENESFGGVVRIIDGDTLDVGGTRVRLHAIDAPEADQTCETPANKRWACGGWVSKVVADRYDGSRAECERLDIDRYGRTVARCRVNGEDIGGWLVREGLAFAYVRYGADYAGIERTAAAQNRGLHAVTLQRPADHRAARKAPVQTATNGCVIKGNISLGGDRIYHEPGQAFYDRTRINKRSGERWFCSAGAAEAAGWRRSLR